MIKILIQQEEVLRQVRIVIEMDSYSKDIPLEKISFTLYFEDIVIKRRYFLKSKDIQKAREILHLPIYLYFCLRCCIEKIFR